MTRAGIMQGAVSTTENIRGTRRLVLTQGPDLVAGGAALEVWVRLYDGDNELKIDPHRVFVNPPLKLVTDDRTGLDLEMGKFIERQTVEGPETAFWDILWSSVDDNPHRRGWQK